MLGADSKPNFGTLSWLLVALSAVAAILSAFWFPSDLLSGVSLLFALPVVSRLDLMSVKASEDETGATLRDSTDLFRVAFDQASIGMALVTSNGRWLRVNHSFCEILGYTKEELFAKDFQAIIHPEDLAPALADISDLLKGNVPTLQREKRYIHKDGHVVRVLWSLSQAQVDGSNSVYLIFQIQDITDRKQAEERLLHDAFHDALTGLPNRALFIDHLKLTIAQSKRNKSRKFAVLFLDLDRFKVVNDSL
jgi:PAS domain S-box-containing protein